MFFSKSMEEITSLITEQVNQVQTIVKSVFRQIQDKTIQIEFSVGAEKINALEELTETIQSSKNLADFNVQSLKNCCESQIRNTCSDASKYYHWK